MNKTNLSVLPTIVFNFYTLLALLFTWSSLSCAQPDVQLAALSNQLKNSPSPYLAAHGEDPVVWQEWNPATLERARRENKLLFVSIGYFSCHWCHVMQAESYRNAEIAAFINQNFIPVKVDRELEVALDAEMIAFAQGILGSAGWPLNVFITPEGYPLYAILYEQPLRFRLMLDSLSKEWQKDSAGLKTIAQNSVKQALPKKKSKPTRAMAGKYRTQLVKEALAQADMLSGGISVPRKFPLSPQLAVLLEIEAIQHDAKLAEWLKLTLDHMMIGGLRDHLAGGFFRYTVDPNWQRPHFEKMLYDNAQLALIYLKAASIFKSSIYRDIAIETLDYMLLDMRVGDGFVTSISALNSKGEEGGSYLWTVEQLKDTLDQDEFSLITKIWGMDTPSDFESGYLPLIHNQPTVTEQKSFHTIYPRLLKVRNERISPKDTKLLAGLNGIALAAFSEAAGIAPRFSLAADKLRSFIVNDLRHDDELQKGVSNGQSLGQADLEGYAYAALGMLQYAKSRNNVEDAKIARQIMQAAWQKFYTAEGFLLEQKSELARPYFQSVIEDGPFPSPSSVLIDASIRSGDTELKTLAEDALGLVDALQNRDLFWHASQVMAMNRLFSVKVGKH